MNPMIAALQKSRSEGPTAPLGGPAVPPEGAPEAPAGDVLAEKFAAMDAKLDQILQLLGAEQKQDASAETDAKETTQNDDGY